MSFWEEFLAYAIIAALILAGLFARDPSYNIRQSHLDNIPAAVIEGDYEEYCAPPDDPDFDCGCDGGPIADHCWLEESEDAKIVQ